MRTATAPELAAMLAAVAARLLEIEAQRGAAPDDGRAMSAAELLERRRLADLTQEQAARLLGVTSRTLARWESAESRIPKHRAGYIREQFGQAALRGR